MRCPRCGNENPASNRFCGMCGTSLLVEPVESRVQAVRATAAHSREPVIAAREESRAPAPEADEAPIITGSSFLGLDQPAPSAPKRASLSADPHASGSRDLDYLLEDEEHTHGSGMGKRILIVVALALAVGLGYLRWKNQGLPWLRTSGSAKPAATTPVETSTDSGGTAASPAPSNPESTPAAAPSQTTTVPTPQTGSEPAATGGTQGAAPASTTPAPASSAGETATPAGGASSDTTPALAAQRPPEHRPAEEEEDPNVTTAVRPATTHPAKPAEVARATKPRPTSPTPVPARETDSVAEAQKYLYGKGAKQDCERGLRLLKPAAAESNPRAMVEMGALYSAGLCTPRDLPTAYRWFAMALRKQPENQALHADLQKLWGEMTQPERQLAIKLTQ